ncbi:MAG: C40 family peptidase [Bacteroidetes bacterium]|nr:C40 family peptidase [Bacteroidota bacterium]
MKILFNVVLFSITLIFAQTPMTDQFSSVLKPIQKKYAPDKRTAIFSVTVRQNDSLLIVKGEVDNVQAKNDVMAAFKKEFHTIADSIEVLPQQSLGEKTYGIVIVSVANMRSVPEESAELASQVLMGHLVKLWKKKSGYYLAQSPDQYLGWVDNEQVIPVTQAEAEAWKNAKKVFVKAYFNYVRSEPKNDAFPVCDITGGGILKDEGKQGSWRKISLADGRTGFLPDEDVMQYSDWGTKLHPLADNIERTGKYLMGVPYLWGGTSTKGVDCSGFTKTVYLLNGLQLNRDANQQAEQGVAVEPGAHFENLKKGDLIFFGRRGDETKPERITHVGIYLGNQEFIHSSSRVHISSFDPSSPIFDEGNLKRFIRARRVIPSLSQLKEVKTK